MAPLSPFDAGGTRPRVLLLLSWLNGGGAERVALHLMGHEALAGFDMRMGLLRRAGPYLALADPARLDHRGWAESWFPSEGSDSSFYRPHRLAMSAVVAPLAFRSMIRAFRPDVVMSFAKGTNLVAHWAMAGMGRGRPGWVAREGNNIARATDDEASGSLARKAAMALARRAYRAADRVLVNSREMAVGTARELGLDPARLRVIHNPTDVDAVRRAAAEPLADPPARPFIVSVGRLERQKGHDLLLRAFAAGRARDGHDLVILGEGTAAESLRALAASLGIADRVRFEPFTENPWAWVKQARLFVLPSRWEGFPNALAEALACGTASLAADCRYGPSELIVHGESGWLVPPEDAEALGAAIDRLTADAALRASLAGEGARRIEAFRLETIVPLYAELFHEQIACRARRAAAAGRPADGPAFALE